MTQNNAATSPADWRDDTVVVWCILKQRGRADVGTHAVMPRAVAERGGWQIIQHDTQRAS